MLRVSPCGRARVACLRLQSHRNVSYKCSSSKPRVLLTVSWERTLMQGHFSRKHKKKHRLLFNFATTNLSYANIRWFWLILFSAQALKMSAYIYKTDAEHNPTSGRNIAFSFPKKKNIWQSVHSKTLFCSNLLFICSCLYLCVWIVPSKPHAETNKQIDLTNLCVGWNKSRNFFSLQWNVGWDSFFPFLVVNCCKFRKFWCKISAKHCLFTPNKRSA